MSQRVKMNDAFKISALTSPQPRERDERLGLCHAATLKRQSKQSGLSTVPTLHVHL
jgi:hypothetical protein